MGKEIMNAPVQRPAFGGEMLSNTAEEDISVSTGRRVFT